MSKSDKYIPWIVVGVAGLILASLGRYMVLKSGGDNGSANLTFIIVLAGVVLAYLALVAFAASMPEFLRNLKKKGVETCSELQETELSNEAESVESESITEQQSAEVMTEAGESNPTISEPRESEQIVEFTATIVEETPIIATEPIKPKTMEQLREEAEAKEAKKKEDDIRLFQEYAHLVLGVYMSDKDVAILDDCIELYANKEVIDDRMKPLMVDEKIKNPDLYHFGWNIHNFFITGETKEIVVDWLQAVFLNMSKLEHSTILGKLKHNERNTYLIPIVEDIRSFMAEQAR